MAKVLVTVDDVARFVNEAWPGEDWYMDDHHSEVFGEDGVFLYEDNVYIPKKPGQLLPLRDFECSILWQGKGDDPGAKSFLNEFRKWNKARTSATVVCDVPKDKADELEAFVKTIGGKVL